ncbi:MAG TPA: DUF222 domain-containing protein [Microbacterium sp.]|nr:DUF222 domain-containing protein [Microbacterium sp.]
MTSRTDSLLDRVGLRAREQARSEARTTVAMLEFADARRAEYEADGPSPHRDLELSSIADELAVEMQLSVTVVQNRLHQAREVRGRAPSAWAAFMDGSIDAYRIQIISAALSTLREPMSHEAVDAKVVDYASTHTASELRSWLKRLVARLEPDRLSERTRDRLGERRVRIAHGDDGISELWALLPTHQVAAIDTMLGEALLTKPSDDSRTSDQYMADELTQRLLTNADGTSTTQIQLALTVPVTSLAGLSNEPGTSLDGRLCLSAETVRDLAMRTGTVFHRVVTDPLGRVLDVTKLGRFATGELDFALTVRDGVCQFPTCTRPADRCDKDHRTPWPHGPTNGQNMWSLCRRHHRIKTAGIVTAGHDEHGQPTWHMPTGRRVAAEQM